MGIPVEEKPELYPTPNACYPSGLMPAWVWLQITGVKKGDEWQDWMGEPRDVLMKLWRQNNEYYEGSTDEISLAWWLSNPVSTQVYAALKTHAVLHNNPYLPGCTDICPDIRQGPDREYFWGGLAEIWTTFDAFGKGYGDKDVNDLIAPDSKTYFEPAKPDNDIRIARYARHRDGTRVYIRRTN